MKNYLVLVVQKLQSILDNCVDSSPIILCFLLGIYMGQDSCFVACIIHCCTQYNLMQCPHAFNTYNNTTVISINSHNVFITRKPFELKNMRPSSNYAILKIYIHVFCWWSQLILTYLLKFLVISKKNFS